MVFIETLTRRTLEQTELLEVRDNYSGSLEISVPGPHRQTPKVLSLTTQHTGNHIRTRICAKTIWLGLFPVMVLIPKAQLIQEDRIAKQAPIHIGAISKQGQSKQIILRLMDPKKGARGQCMHIMMNPLVLRCLLASSAQPVILMNWVRTRHCKGGKSHAKRTQEQGSDLLSVCSSEMQS